VIKKTSKGLKAHLGACCYGHFPKVTIKDLTDSFHSPFVLQFCLLKLNLFLFFSDYISFCFQDPQIGSFSSYTTFLPPPPPEFVERGTQRKKAFLLHGID